MRLLKTDETDEEKGITSTYSVVFTVISYSGTLSKQPIAHSDTFLNFKLTFNNNCGYSDTVIILLHTVTLFSNS